MAGGCPTTSDQINLLAAKVVPTLLLSHQRTCSALNAWWGLLNAVSCMVVRVLAGDEDGAGRTLSSKTTPSEETGHVQWANSLIAEEK